MTDLISRQAAIDALRYAQRRFTVADEANGSGVVRWSEYVIFFDKAEEILADLPSAQPEPDTALYTDGFNDGYKQGKKDAQPETAKRIVGKSRDGITLWYQCDMCNEPVDEQDDFCRRCGRRLTNDKRRSD